MREILKVALGVFVGGGALLIALAFVDEVRTQGRATAVMRELSKQSGASPAAPAAVDACAGSKDPACGIIPNATSVNCLINGETWRLSSNVCAARRGKIE